MKKPYLLFDAGGTLTFPDMLVLRDTARKYGQEAEEQDVFRAYCELIHGIDDFARENGKLPEPYPHGIGWAFFEHLGLVGEALPEASEEITAYNLSENLWSFTYPWVRDTLDKLQEQGYRMSVLSNSDGRVAQLLEWLGLAGYFETIFDSHILGVEKPDVKIFETALETLDIDPGNTLYIGDVFYIDVWGANNAGLPAVHLDPLHLYNGWSGARVDSVATLPAFLPGKNLEGDEFFPTRGFVLQVP